MVRDIDLALFGLLPQGQLLGGPVERPDLSRLADPADARRDQTAPVTAAVQVPADVARLALDAGGLVLRDEESTPLARLEPIEAGSAEAIADADSAEAVLVVGTLTRVRQRESGQARQLAVHATDLWPTRARTVVVLGRPPVRADDAPIRAAAQGTESLLLVVPDDPDADVPTAVLVDVARLWLDEIGLAGDVRTASLASRDATSDAATAALLTHALGGGPGQFLDRHGDSAGAKAWRASRAVLEHGSDDLLLPELHEPVAARLRRWRPPRTRRGLVLMFSGLSGSGKSTLARDLYDWLTGNTERTVSMLDGDVVRQLLSAGLGFGRAAREMNVRRIGYVGAEIARHGGIAICAPIAPYAATREEVRRRVNAVGDFVLVHVSTPLAECERRDLKGLYAKARAGTIPEFTGISDPYEAPADAELAVDTSVVPREQALDTVVRYLRDGGWVT
ncbi:MAG TPA: adenylyl-sulfate kinase [Dermatophilaceae bacterium]|nr:adenylyl-sulfate kinase [Dermatophilaceae bacterium]